MIIAHFFKFFNKNYLIKDITIEAIRHKGKSIKYTDTSNIFVKNGMFGRNILMHITYITGNAKSKIKSFRIISAVLYDFDLQISANLR